MKSRMKLILILTLMNILVNADDEILPCLNVDYIKADYVNFLTFGSYFGYINKELKNGTEIVIQLSGNATLTVNDDLADLAQIGDAEYEMILLKPTKNFRFFVKRSQRKFDIISIVSVRIDGIEHCERPTVGSRPKNETVSQGNELTCGRRKINHNQLIVYGGVTRPGDFPWHVALNTIIGDSFRYICGGTLISETFVLTAAHCVTRNGITIVPDSIGVSLGRHSLIGGDKEPQDRQVFKIIVHEEFKHKNLDNDIALLKLSTPVIYNDYIQPACVWYDIDISRLPVDITGVVVGWGFDQSDKLSPDLRFAKMPIVPDLTCIKRKPIFYGNFLNGKRFCAGVLNGTSACNGDSGGSYAVFVPDIIDSKSQSGVWAVRGIVSIAIKRENDLRSLCDPNEYVLFTDVSVYEYWIKDHIQ